MKKIVQSAFEKFRCSAVFLEKITNTDGIHIPHNAIQQILEQGIGRRTTKEKKETKGDKI